MKIGIDLGGTKTEIIVLDESGAELYRRRMPSPQGDYQATINTIAQLVHDAEQTLTQSTLASVGIGIPGSICKTTYCVKNANSIWLNGQPLLHDLEQALQRPIKIANDANCFALSETLDGAGVNQRSVFGVIIGTGCGGGLYCNGQLITGANGIGGEWGHNPLPFPRFYCPETIANTSRHFFDAAGTTATSAIYRHKQTPDYFTANPDENEFPGPLCYCGKRGCLETWISGTGFEQDYFRITGEKLTAQAIIAAAESGDHLAQASFDRYCERLAKSLAQIINSVDPDVIVLGGGMSNIERLYSEVPQRWDRYIFSTTSQTPLKKAVHGDSSGVRGAALLWDDMVVNN